MEIKTPMKTQNIMISLIIFCILFPVSNVDNKAVLIAYIIPNATIMLIQIVK